MITLAHLAQSPSRKDATKLGAFALALQRALRRENLSWPLFCLLLAAADSPLKSRAHLAIALELSYDRIYLLTTQHSDYFTMSEDKPGKGHPVTVSLSPEGEALLAAVLIRATVTKPK